MSQSAYEIFLLSTDLYKLVIQFTFFMCLWIIFYPVKKGKRTLEMVLLFAVVNIVLGLWSEVPLEIGYLICAVIMFLYNYRYNRDCRKAILVLLLFYNFHSLSYLIANSAYQYVVNILMKKFPVTVVEDVYMLYRNVAIGMLAMSLIYTFLFAAMVLVLKKVIVKPFPMNWTELMFLSAFNIAGCMLAKMVIKLTAIKINDEVFYLYDERTEMFWWIPAMAILIYAGEITIIYVYQKYREVQREREKYFVEKQQIKVMKQRLEEVEDFYGNIRKVRHEMKNHMTNIKGLVVSEQYKEVDGYIKKLDETIQELEYRYATGNAVTDVVINDKWQKAIKSGIRFEVDFHYMGNISAFDIAIVLNNLLDNAIEACVKLEQEKRYINLTFRRKNHFLLLEVENSFSGALKWEDGIAMPLTSKQNDLPDLLMDHGIGLKNVKDVAERYLGDMDIKVRENVFKVTVMLQEKEDNYENHNTNVK